MARETFLNIVEKMFQRNGGLTRIKGELAVYYWPRIAGNDLSSKVEAVGYRNGTLVLQTDNPALAHQITFMSQEILQRYQRVLGRDIIKNVKMKIGTVRTVTENTAPVIGLSLKPEEAQDIQECVKDVKDPVLAEKFSRMMTSCRLQNKKISLQEGDSCQACGVPILKGYSYCPCCERQIREEIKEYQRFLKISDEEVATASIDRTHLAETHQKMIQAMLKVRPS